MRVDPRERSSDGEAAWIIVLGLWGVFAIIGAVKLGTHPYRHSSFFIYQAGAEAWLAGGSPYDPSPYPPEARTDEPPLFRYSPPFAAAMTPFAALPIRLASVVWVLGSLGALLYACRRLFHAVEGSDGTKGEEAAFLLVALGGAIRPTLSGNAHVLAAACTVFAAAAVIERKYWQAAFALPFAIFAKAAPLVFGGLLAIAKPWATIPRFGLALVATAAIPALVHGPTDAREVYARWFSHLSESNADRWPSFRDLWLVWETSGIPFSVTAYRGLQVALGLFTLVAVVVFLRSTASWPRRVLAITGLAQAYLLLCGPAVEFTQFVVAAPWLGLALIHARRNGRDFPLAVAATTFSLILGNSPVERTLVRALGSDWPKAACTFGALLFAIYVIRNGVRPFPAYVAPPDGSPEARPATT